MSTRHRFRQLTAVYRYDFASFILRIIVVTVTTDKSFGAAYAIAQKVEERSQLAPLNIAPQSKRSRIKQC